jgi:hypothetical protein
MKRLLILAGSGLLLLLIAIQLVPYGRQHANPPVRQEPVWDSPQTRALAARACYDCHSNETAWPWYSNVAPLSWLVQRDVDQGRQVLNFSEWDRPQEEADEAAETVEERTMPPANYLALHPQANLSAAERQALIQGLEATLEGEEEEEGGQGRGRGRGRGRSGEGDAGGAVPTSPSPGAGPNPAQPAQPAPTQAAEPEEDDEPDDEVEEEEEGEDESGRGRGRGRGRGGDRDD